MWPDNRISQSRMLENIFEAKIFHIIFALLQFLPSLLSASLSSLSSCSLASSAVTQICTHACMHMQFFTGILFMKWVNNIMARSVIVINRPNIHYTIFAQHIRRCIYQLLWRLLITRFHLGKYLLWPVQAIKDLPRRKRYFTFPHPTAVKTNAREKHLWLL